MLEVFFEGVSFLCDVFSKIFFVKSDWFFIRIKYYFFRFIRYIEDILDS